MYSTTCFVTSESFYSIFGNSVTWIATVMPPAGPGPFPPMTGSVSFYNGSSLLGVAVITGGGSPGTATFSSNVLGAGSYTIEGVYSGDSNYTGSNGTCTQTADRLASPLEISASARVGTPASVLAQATYTSAPPMAPTGLATFTDNGTTIAYAPFQLAAFTASATATVVFSTGGSQTVAANYPGDANYLPMSTSLPITVEPAVTGLAINSSANPSAACQPVTFNVTVGTIPPNIGPPTGTVAFTINGNPGPTVTLVNAQASFTTSTLSSSNTVDATYSGSTSFQTCDNSLTQFASGTPTSWQLTGGVANSDPFQGATVQFGNITLWTQTGAVRVVGPTVDPSQSGQCTCPCSCGCNPNKSQVSTCPPLVYTYAPPPLIVGTLSTDFCLAVPPNITVTAAWNGSPISTTTTLTTSGHSPGDVYAISAQPPASLAATAGFYPWSLTASTTIGGTPYSSTSSGSSMVVGSGWSLGSTSGVTPGNSAAIVANGTPGSRTFSGTPTTLPYTFTSPANDQGTLVQNADSSFTYTSKAQVQTNFSSTGQQLSQVDPNGLVQTYTYATSSSPLPSSIVGPDGGMATFNYTGSQLTSVSGPSGTISIGYDGSGNLNAITDAAGNDWSFTYDGDGRMTFEQVGPLNVTLSYSPTNSSLTNVNLGGSMTTLTAAATQGLGSSAAINASQQVSVLTDALGNTTTTTLDSLGRTTQIITADGAVQNWTLNAAGNPTTYIDQLGRVTTYMYNAAQDLTQIQYPDGTFTTYAYDPTFHEVTQTIDALGHITTNTYDPTTGNQLTAVDALGNTTTMTWSNGLLQTTTDALGRVTTNVWDSARRVQLAQIDPLGNITSYGYDSAGNQITVQDALGRVTTSSYDGNRQLINVTDALGGVMSYSYDGAGNQITSTDQLGRTATYAYDQRNLQISVTQLISTQPVQMPGKMLAFQLASPLGTLGAPPTRTTTTTYDAVGNVLYVTDPLADVTSYAYDPVYRRIAQIDAYGTGLQRTTTTSYDLVGNVIQSIDARGTTTSYAYSVRNWQIQRTNAAGDLQLQQTTNTSYDAVGNVQTVTDPLGTVTSFGYDANNRQTQRVEAYGISGLQRTTTTAYDPVGNTLSVTNAVGAVTSYGYDADNRRVLMIEAQGSGVQRTTTTNYDAVGNVQSSVNPRGVTTSYAYDPLNRRVNEIDGYGTGLQRTLTTSYDAVSNVQSMTNGLGVTTSFGFDALNRRVTQLDAFGTGLQRVSTINYDADDNVTSKTDPLGFVTAFVYDALNRRISVINPDGGIATTGYDANDNVVATTDQLGHTSTFSYDILNRKVTTTDALGGVVTLSYDANNNLISLTDPVANQTQWQLDALNRQVQEIDPLYNISTMAYDAVDRVNSATDKNGQLINYSYDLLDREIGEAWIVGTITQNLLTFTYDPSNNMLTAANNIGTITRTYDSLNRLSTTQDMFGTRVTNSYDAANNRLVIQDSFGGIITRTFDALNRAATTQYTGQNAALREDYAYSARDQVTNQTRYSNLAGTTTVGYSTFSYDSVGRMTNLQHLNGSGSNIANYSASPPGGMPAAPKPKSQLRLEGGFFGLTAQT